MSQANVEMVRNLYGFWQDRDYAAVEGAIHPDVVVDLSRNVFNPGIYRGVEGFRRNVVEQVDEMWDDFRIEPQRFIDADDTVVVAARISGKGRSSGVKAEMPVFAAWTLREGKVSRVTGGFRDRGDALEAAGLSE